MQVLNRGEFLTVIESNGSSEYVVALHHRGSRIGHVRVVRVRPIVAGRRIELWETHSQLSPTYHNRGLGIVLYSAAIEWGLSRGRRVTSSRRSSSDAVRCWSSRRLGAAFSVVRIGERFWASRRPGV